MREEKLQEHRLISLLLLIGLLLNVTMLCSYLDLRGTIPAALAIIFVIVFGVRPHVFNANALRLSVAFGLMASYLLFSLIWFSDSKIDYFFYWLYLIGVLFLAPIMIVRGKPAVSVEIKVVLLKIVVAVNISVGLFSIINFWYLNQNILNPNLASICLATQFVSLYLAKHALKGLKFLSLMVFLTLLLSFSRSAIGFCLFILLALSVSERWLGLLRLTLFAMLATVFILFVLPSYEINLFDVIQDNQFVKNLIRFKGDISSDELRFFRNPSVLMHYLDSNFLSGLGVGARGYYALLDEGMDLESFFLVGISDVGLIGVGILLIAMSTVYYKQNFRIILFILILFNFSNFSSFIFLGAPALTLGILLIIPIYKAIDPIERQI